MDWITIWASLGNQFPDEFKQYIESHFPDGTEATDLTEIASSLSEEYQTWLPTSSNISRYADLGAAPATPAATSNGEVDAEGNALPYVVGRVYTFTDPATGQKYRQVFNGQKYIVTGKDAATGQSTYAPQDSWGTPQWIDVAGTTPDTMSAYEQKQVDLQNQKLSQDWSAQQTDQQNLNWGRAQSDINNAVATQNAAIPTMSPETPVNWIKNWQESQAADQARLNQGRRQAATSFYSQNMTPEQKTQILATNPPNQDLWNRGYYGDPNYNIATQGFTMGMLNEQDAVKGQAAQDFERSNTNPADNQSYIYALQTGIPGAAEQYQAAQTSWNAARQQAVDAAVASYNTPTTTAGPTNPYWTKSFNVPTQGSLLDVKALGNQWLAPASASTYQSMSPTEQQGLSGLAGASRWGKYSGGSPDDYWANTQNMWQASRPGQLAQRRAWGYG